jgi:non-homologous end joining protein Ku
MARALWTGSLSFGLVNVPVSLVPAVRDLDLRFRRLHRKDGAPIEVQRWCSKESVELPYGEITHGYELDDGGRVVISDLELEAIEPRKPGRSTSSVRRPIGTLTRSTSTIRTSSCRPPRMTAPNAPTGC